MGPATVTVTEGEPGYFHAVLRGDVDLTCRDGLRRLLARYALSDQASVLVDLSAVTSLSSTGLSTLAALEEEARRRNGHLRLRNAPAGLMPVLSAAGLSVATVVETGPERVGPDADRVVIDLA